LPNSKKWVIPTIEKKGNGAFYFVFGNYESDYFDPDGTYKDLNLCLKEGNNYVKLYSHDGASSVKFIYREGVL
jgi:hypothetical protein